MNSIKAIKTLEITARGTFDTSGVRRPAPKVWRDPSPSAQDDKRDSSERLFRQPRLYGLSDIVIGTCGVLLLILAGIMLCTGWNVFLFAGFVSVMVVLFSAVLEGIAEDARKLRRERRRSKCRD